jgi:hypothetical protein
MCISICYRESHTEESATTRGHLDILSNGCIYEELYGLKFLNFATSIYVVAVEI